MSQLPENLAVLPVSAIIFLVGQDMANVNLAAIEVDGSDQAVLVTTDVENDKRANHIGAGKGCTESPRTLSSPLAPRPDADGAEALFGVNAMKVDGRNRLMSFLKSWGMLLAVLVTAASSRRCGGGSGTVRPASGPADGQGEADVRRQRSATTLLSTSRVETTSAGPGDHHGIPRFPAGFECGCQSMDVGPDVSRDKVGAGG